MRLGHYLHKLRTLPPGEVIRRARDKAQDRFQAALRKWNGRRKPTYSVHPPAWLGAGIARLLPSLSAPDSAAALEACRLLAGNALAHRFNLLGSGWVESHSPESTADSAINESNRAEARRIRGLVGSSYRPIGWQVDFKSGYRWPADGWHTEISFGSTPGTDVKVPWELSRMQHLHQLAHAYAAARAGLPGFALPSAYPEEFRNQVLDFIAANAPGFGVNWVCTMDVGIRIANWLMARDLFLAYGAAFDPAFEAEFAKSVYEHGRHIIGNLEWGPGLRGNHYYADIAGLAAAAACLPASTESNAWLAFSVRELVAETRIQFLPDGSNFEASTCYHRLSAEMLAYATALVLALPAARLQGILAAPSAHRRHFPRFFRYSAIPGHAYPGWGPVPFPPWYLERLERAAEFVIDITRPDGRVPQIGDNDSGRFLKLFPAMSAPEEVSTALGGEEDFLDHRHLVAAVNGFFGRGDFAAFAEASGADCETAIVKGLLGGKGFPSYRDAKAPSTSMPARYPDFGLFIYRRDDAYLAFRCGPIGQLGTGGHAHNDQLSFELAVGGVPFLEDRGTYLYTADWANRNRFRSTAWHNTLSVEGGEQNPWENTRPGLFMLISKSHAQVLGVDGNSISGRHVGFGAPHTRSLHWRGRRLDGADSCESPGAKYVRFHFCREVALSPSQDGRGIDAERNGVKIRLRGEGGSWALEEAATSPSYGVMRKAPMAVLSHSGQTPVKWYIEWPL